MYCVEIQRHRPIIAANSYQIEETLCIQVALADAHRARYLPTYEGICTLQRKMTIYGVLRIIEQSVRPITTKSCLTMHQSRIARNGSGRLVEFPAAHSTSPALARDVLWKALFYFLSLISPSSSRFPFRFGFNSRS